MFLDDIVFLMDGGVEYLPIDKMEEMHPILES